MVFMSDLYPCPDCGNLRGIGRWPLCPDHGIPRGGTRLQAIHTSERTVLYRNPRTGEIRTPARNDLPMPEVYARQGYVREELDTAAKIRSYEQSTGKIHERSHYDPGSGTAEREMLTYAPEAAPPKDPEITKSLVQFVEGMGIR